ncbi:MAG: hypothetical protein AAFY71_16395 [Bacteroidota bacterium]
MYKVFLTFLLAFSITAVFAGAGNPTLQQVPHSPSAQELDIQKTKKEWRKERKKVKKEIRKGKEKRGFLNLASVAMISAITGSVSSLLALLAIETAALPILLYLGLIGLALGLILGIISLVTVGYTETAQRSKVLFRSIYAVAAVLITVGTFFIAIV